MSTENNSTALITGATSGIGAAYAQRLAKEGYNLIITGRREEKINSLAATLRDTYHVDVEVIIIELSQADEVDQFLEEIEGRNIDILINNAGFGTTKFFYREPLELQEKMVATHILAAMKLTYAILPGMIEKGRGTIIYMSSAGAFLATPDTATYSGTKAFLRAFTESLHLELMPTGVKVQVVCPGLTKTDMHLRLGIPEEYTVDSGLMRWITPEKVVDDSLKCLQKNRVVCIPGWLTRLQVFMRNMLPASFYYRSAYYIFKKYQWIRDE